MTDDYKTSSPKREDSYLPSEEKEKQQIECFLNW